MTPKTPFEIADLLCDTADKYTLARLVTHLGEHELRDAGEREWADQLRRELLQIGPELASIQVILHVPEEEEPHTR